MDDRIYLIVALALLVSGVVPTQPHSAFGTQSEPSELKVAAQVWASANRDAAADLVFQNTCRGLRSPEAGRQWVVCVRITPYETQVEYALSLERDYDGTVRGGISRPKGRSIYAQLVDLKMKRPGATVGELAGAIAFETGRADQRESPALVRLADDFEHIRFSPVLSDELYMDGITYVFDSRSGPGNHLELTLLGPPRASRQPSGLLEWAESLRQTLIGSLR